MLCVTSESSIPNTRAIRLDEPLKHPGGEGPLRTPLGKVSGAEMDAPTEGIGVTLDRLFREPRAANGETIVCLVHEAMEEAGSKLVPDRSVPVVNWAQAKCKPPEGTVLVDWALVDKQAMQFVLAVERWVETGTPDDKEAVLATASLLVRDWVEAVQWALLHEKFPQLGQGSEGDPCQATIDWLVLQGIFTDTGRRRHGETVWGPTQYARLGKGPNA